MKTIPSLAVLTVLFLTGFIPVTLHGAEEGVALAIVYDTSGSMKEPVPDASGGSAPKYVIANRALLAVTRQLQAFATNSVSGTHRNIQAGLFIFQGEHAREVIKLGPFDANSFERWATHFTSPNGNTPLGNALTTATRAVLDSPLSRKHVLVITDGINTAGPSPHTVLPRLKQQAEQKHASVSVHFVAFDVDARQFAPLKRLGATVVGAADEKQLNSQLQFILQQKILLEDEEPPKTR
jgi:Mg-chelatase subunit ChlD